MNLGPRYAMIPPAVGQVWSVVLGFREDDRAEVRIYKIEHDYAFVERMDGRRMNSNGRPYQFRVASLRMHRRGSRPVRDEHGQDVSAPVREGHVLRASLCEQQSAGELVRMRRQRGREGKSELAPLKPPRGLAAVTDRMRAAVRRVQEGESRREVAASLRIPKGTLAGWIRKVKDAEEDEQIMHGWQR